MAHSGTEQKTGYLNGDFALFHLKDMKNTQFEYHYHDFNKIIVFISGSVTYLIEGRAYRLKPWDILFVNNNELHRPIIDPSVTYERIVIWVNPDFLEKHGGECDFFTCFKLAGKRENNLLRPGSALLKDFGPILAGLENACKSTGFGATILKNSIFFQFLIVITRELLGISSGSGINDIISDGQIREILDYINLNLNSDLSVDTLAARFYMSRYHLMHKFREQTGFPVHSYIVQKRLIKADALVRAGVTAAQACEQSGFSDYSSFVRAYKKMFGTSPKNRTGRLAK